MLLGRLLGLNEIQRGVLTEQSVDRESAYEKLKARTADMPAKAEPASIPGPTSGPKPTASGALQDLLLGSTGPRGGKREGMLESAARSAARSIGSGMGRQILRGVLGSMFGGRR